MLRRRILASAMASVMAIGSVAVVASADETAASTTQAKTKADLEAYVKSFDKFLEDAIYDYGATAGANFQDAIDYAQNVLDDATATSEEYTVAYLMLENVYASLKTYTSAELKTLIDNTKKTYETDNMLNSDNTDEIYTSTTFSEFVTAYDYANSIAGSSDSRLVTDAYVELNNAYKNLKALKQITKKDFRTALKAYEGLFTKENMYDDWRRGSIDCWIDNSSTKNFWALQQSVDSSGITTFGTLKSVVFDGEKVQAWMMLDIFQGMGGKTTREYINDAYEAFDAVETVSKTTNPEWVNAYQIALDAVTTFNSFKPDASNRANKASVTSLLNTYHIQLVGAYNTSGADALYNAITGQDPTTTNADFKVSTRMTYDVNGDGRDEVIPKGTDIRKYVDVDSSMITSDADVDVAIKQAMYAYEQYTLAVPNYSDDVHGLDDTKTVTTANGSPAEWTLIYRKLKYALGDKFKATASYTKADVVAYIEKCYELAEKTGDAAIFKTEHMALVEARQDALAWLREANADKKYTDYTAYTGGTATDVYGNLKTNYEALEKFYKKYLYSYGEIYKSIADVAAKIDAGELLATEKLVSALTKTAYDLSTMQDVELTNEVFSSDRQFNDFNRLRTDADTATTEEKTLKADYEALLAEVAAQATPDVVLGDVDGNGVVNALDASAILKAVVNNTAIDTKVGDYNSDGAVNALDAAAILKFVVSQ